MSLKEHEHYFSYNIGSKKIHFLLIMEQLQPPYLVVTAEVSIGRYHIIVTHLARWKATHTHINLPQNIKKAT